MGGLTILVGLEAVVVSRISLVFWWPRLGGTYHCSWQIHKFVILGRCGGVKEVCVVGVVLSMHRIYGRNLVGHLHFGR